MKEQHKISKKFAAGYIIAGSTLWGMIGLFSTYLARGGCSSVQITFLRNLIAAAGLWIYLLLFRRDRLKISIRDIWMFFGTGVLSIVFFNIMYFTAIRLTTLSMAAILLYTAPFFVMLMSAVIFSEKVTAVKVKALLLALFGCACTTGIFHQIISGKGLGNLSILGIFTGILSGFGYALYSIFGNRALKKYDTFTVTAYSFLFAAFFLAPFCFRKKLLVMAFKGNMVFFVLGIGIISTLLPFLLYTKGLTYTEPGKASVMAFAEPAVATLIGVFLLHQTISLSAAGGILIIFISIFLLNIDKKISLRKS